MLRLFHALCARIKAMFAADAALEIQAEIAVRGAERKAQLYRLAAQYEEEGFASVAHDLRRQAEALHLQQSVGDVIPAIDDLLEDNALDVRPAATVEGLPSQKAIAVPIEANPKVSAPVRPRKR